MRQFARRRLVWVLYSILVVAAAAGTEIAPYYVDKFPVTAANALYAFFLTILAIVGVPAIGEDFISVLREERLAREGLAARQPASTASAPLETQDAIEITMVKVFQQELGPILQDLREQPGRTDRLIKDFGGLEQRVKQLEQARSSDLAEQPSEATGRSSVAPGE